MQLPGDRQFTARLALVCGLIMLGLQAWPGASELLRFSRASYAQGAFWQLLSAQWVHLSAWHAGANALAFVLIVGAGAAWIGWPLQLLALCGGYAGVALVVALDADCRYYAGASGALHGLLAGNAIAIGWAVQGQPVPPNVTAAAALALRQRRLLGMAILAALALKLWLQAGRVAKAPLGEWGFPVYHPAHIAGALGGAALVSVFLAMRAMRALRAGEVAKAPTQRGQ